MDTEASKQRNKHCSSVFDQEQPPPTPSPLRKIIVVASIAAGVQFGWALQLSLLTPYVQLLGIPHKWAAFIWLCGPVSGMLVQPIVGYYSDICTSRFGRRRPFIASGAFFVAIAVVLIGYAADIGHHFGDSLEKNIIKRRAISVFVVGFWILDVANNMLQGPCRALLADLSDGDQTRTRTANSFYSFFMAVGNILGYAAGSYTHLYKLFPLSKTEACDVYCANLKSCFIIAICVLMIVTVVALIYVPEKQWSPEECRNRNDTKGDDDEDTVSNGPIGGQLLGALKTMQKPMWILLLVTCLNWIAWFPFLLFDTDWMGREVYGGNSNGNDDQERLYDRGVRAGALGLMLNSVVLGFMSLGIEYSARLLGGVKRLWGIVNIILAVCLSMTVLISKMAESYRKSHGTLSPPPMGIRAGALAVFSVMGIPLAVTFSIPFALASIFSSSSGSGQGLSLGVLNLSIVIPQMVVSVASGPWDDLFGGGNLPAFVIGAIAAAVSGILAFTLLPSPVPHVPVPASKNSGLATVEK